jgi:hypothetical protein
MPFLRLDQQHDHVINHITFLNSLDDALPYDVDDVLGQQNMIQTTWKYLDKSIAPSKLIETYI